MSANNYTNWDLVKYSALLSFLVFFNYFLWSINSWQILKYINFCFIIFTFFYFFISKKFNYYWYLKIIIFLLLIICLGIPTIPIDARFVYLFPGKILFYESNLYILLESHLLEIITSRPKLPATLSATFAQLVGSWNEIFPKSANIIIILPAIIFLISFLKDKLLILFWLFLMLFFSGKLLINGLMDGILSLYFVASILLVYKISITQNKDDKNLLYFVMFNFFAVLSLCKNEGPVMILVILFSFTFVNFVYEKKINYNIFLIALLSLLPFLFWKFLVIKNSAYFTLFEYEVGSPLTRFFNRVTNIDDLGSILSYIIKNEKLFLSIIIFIFCSLKFFKNNKKLVFFVVLNFFLYFIILIGAFLIDPFDLILKLNTSSTRVFIPLVLLFSYFSIFLLKDEKFFNQNRI